MKQRTLKEQLDSFAKTVGSWNSRKDVEFRTVKAAAKHLVKAYEDVENLLLEAVDKMKNFYDNRNDIDIPMDEAFETLNMFARELQKIVAVNERLTDDEAGESAAEAETKGER